MEKPVTTPFALVSYLPQPLREFLDDLRRELSPGCHAKAHVTILPPRPIQGVLAEARRELGRQLAGFPPFLVELGEVEVFPSTQVVYISLRRGSEELHRMHTALNAGGIEFTDLFPYHPHVTLAQDLQLDQSAAAAELARRRWSGPAPERAFIVQRLTLVQNVENFWRDLEAWDLAE